jgi:dephospho-CoA kinase
MGFNNESRTLSQRVLKRDLHRTEQQVQTIIDRQLSEDEKLKKADYIIYNDDKQLLITQVLKLHQEFLFQAEQV